MVRILLKVALNIITLTLRVKGHIQYFAVWTKIFNFVRAIELQSLFYQNFRSILYYLTVL